MKVLLQSRAVSYFAAGGAVLFWASSFAAIRYSLRYYSPEAIMLFRFIIASAVLLGYCVYKKIPLPQKRDIPLFIASGFVGLFIYMWAFITGTSFVSAGISSFVIATSPIFTLILSIVLLKEKAGLLIWVGVLISFAGIAVISLSQAGEVQRSIGILLLLAASVSTSMLTIIQKRLLQKYTALQCSAYSVGFAVLFMFIFLPALVREFPHAPMYANFVIVYLGVFPAATAYFLWSLALSKAEKTVYVTSVLYLVPFLASIIAFLWLGEEMPALALLGGVIIITGMVITNVMQRRRVVQ